MLPEIPIKIPIFCSSCESIIRPIDVKYFYDWGVCSNCTIDFIEGKESKFTKNKDNSNEIKKLLKKNEIKKLLKKNESNS